MNENRQKETDKKAFNITVQGASHIKKNKICQDNSFSFSDGKNYIIIVCDGHGGDNYFRSDKGSLYACRSAYECISEFLICAEEFNQVNTKRKNEMIEQLEKSIISLWNEKVQNDVQQNPFSDEEMIAVSDKMKTLYLSGEKIESAYGTTLIAVVATENFWLGIQLGDGKCVVLQDDISFNQPIPWNDKCFLNETTSMCDFDAFNNFRYYYSEVIPVAIYIGSDGIDDCFGDVSELYSLYGVISKSFSETEFEQAKEELEEYLPRLSEKGSGDDMSVAAIIDIEKLKEIIE